MGLTRLQRQVYEYVRDNSPVNQSDVVFHFEKDYLSEESARQSIGQVLKFLKLMEYIERVPSKDDNINTWKATKFNRRR